MAQMNRLNPEGTRILYRIDARLSTFTVQAFAGGILSRVGHNPIIAIRDVSGDVHFDTEDPDQSSLTLAIRSSSLTVTDDVNDKDRREIEEIMHARILRSELYPMITYESMRVSSSQTEVEQYRVVIQGRLSMRGVTHQQNIEARFFNGVSTVTAQGEFSILQSEYGIERVSVAGGVLKIKDELKFKFNMVARKQD